MSALLGQPTTALAYREWYECRRKRGYASHDEAQTSADWQETPASRPHSYDCEWCGGIHLGRERLTKNQKHKRKLNRLRPTRRQLRIRPDVTLIGILGERAFWCGHAESTGSAHRRMHVISQRLRLIEKRARAAPTTEPSEEA